jgi:hypothetical protein
VGAAAPERGVSECGAILLDCNRAVKESDIAEQPCLIVTHLKLNEARGQIALWVGTGTDGFFEFDGEIVADGNYDRTDTPAPAVTAVWASQLWRSGFLPLVMAKNSS